MIPQYRIQKGELHALLLRRVTRLLGKDKIHLSHALDSLTDTGDEITVNLIHRYTNTELPSASADLLLACDEINSAGRK